MDCTVSHCISHLLYPLMLGHIIYYLSTSHNQRPNMTTNYVSMMLQIPSFSLLFTFFLFLFMVVKHWKRQRSAPKLPPGPWKLPLIGNLHQLIGSTLPHHSLGDLSKKHGPIMHLKLGEVSSIIISSPKAAEEVLKMHELNFAQRPKVLAVDVMGYGDLGIVFSPYGDYWRQLRKVCILELLSSKRVHSFRSLREEEVLNFIESISLSLGCCINLSDKLLQLTNCVTSRAAIGDKCKDADEFISTMKEGIKLSGGFDMFDTFPSLKILQFLSRTMPVLEELHVRLDKILEKIINEHKAKRATNDAPGEEDLVDVLLKLQESGDLEIPITTTHIKAIISDIFSAGTETSATTIEWAMSEMLRNPTVLKKAQSEVRQTLKRGRKISEEELQELDYLKLVIKETLRLHPPAPLFIRESRQSCQIGGYTIPKKTKVIINFWAIGRDAEYWKDAEHFRPERFQGSSITYQGNNFEYIPFGAGRRICPGISFANATMELVLALLLYHFDWKLPGGIKPEELDMGEEFGITVKKKNDLCVIASPA